MKTKEVVLVILLVLIGGAIYAVQTGRWDFRFGDGDEIFFKAWTYAFEESQTIAPPLPGRLEIDNSHGGVEVEAADQEAITLVLVKHIHRRKEADALEIADRLKAVVVREADRIRITTNREDFEKKNFETFFKLVVPRGTDVSVVNSYGLVRAVGTRETTLVNRHGALRAANIEGRLLAETSYDDLEVDRALAGCEITARHADARVANVTGDATVVASYGEVRLEDVSGRGRVTGQHAEVICRRIAGEVEAGTSYEPITLEDVGPARVDGRHADVKADAVRGALVVLNRYARVEAADIAGGLRIEGRNVAVAARNVRGGEIRVVSSYEDVDLLDVEGPVFVGLAHGDLVLEPRTLAAAITVRNEHGAVELRWPHGEENPFEARTRGGSVQWGLAASPALNQTNGTAILKAFPDSSGRPEISIETSYGDISIVPRQPSK
jgi:hypothetical protein